MKPLTDKEIKELIRLGFRPVNQWYFVLRVKVPTYYYTDTAGVTHTA